MTASPGAGRRAEQPSAADYARLLATLEAASACGDRASFGTVVSDGLLELLAPAVSVSYNEISPDVSRTASIVRPDPGAAWFDEYQEFYETHMSENPLLVEALANGLTTPRDWLDVDPRRAFEKTSLFTGFYVPNGIRSQLGFTVPVSDGSLVAIVVNRDGAPFSVRERALVSAAIPLLTLAHRYAATGDGPLVRPAGTALGQDWSHDDPARAAMHARLTARGLTARQAEVVAHAASGATNHQIGTALGVSPGTVRKHLENAYARLAVTNRVAAAAIALSDAPLGASEESHPPRAAQDAALHSHVPVTTAPLESSTS